MYRLVAAGLVAPLAYASGMVSRGYTGRPGPFWIMLLVLAAAALSAGVVASDGVALLVSLGLGWCLATLSAIDLRVQRLPDPITLPLIAAGLIQAALTQPEQTVPRLVGAAAGYGVLATVALIYRRVRLRDGLGLGDAKLLAAAGAWVGWRALPEVLLIGSLCGLAWTLLRRRGRDLNGPLAFGPWLALATWVVWLSGLAA